MLKVMEGSYFLLRLAQVRRRREGFCHGFAFDSPGEPMVGPVTFPLRLGTVTGGFATLAECGGNGTSAKITDADQLSQQVGSPGLQVKQGIGHGLGLLFLAYIYAKKCATKKEPTYRPLLCRAPPPCPRGKIPRGKIETWNHARPPAPANPHRVASRGPSG